MMVDVKETTSPQSLELLLRESPIAKKEPLWGKSEPELVTLENGLSGVWKPESKSPLKILFKRYSARGREVAAYKVSQIAEFGLVPATVLREVDGELGSLQFFIPDPAKTLIESIDLQDKKEVGQIAGQLVAVDFLDFLTGNLDRHPGNILIDKAGILWTVDHTSSHLPGSNKDILGTFTAGELSFKASDLSKENKDNALAEFKSKHPQILNPQRVSQMQEEMEKSLASLVGENEGLYVRQAQERLASLHKILVETDSLDEVYAGLRGSLESN